MRRFLIICSVFIFFINILTVPVLAQTSPKCEQYEEIFSFEVPTYKIQHQGGATLGIKVAYRLTPEASDRENYPDAIPVQKNIDKFLVDYPNESDYWEILNKNLVQFLLEQYPQMSSLRVELDVMPTLQEPFRRSSIVKSTRPQSCEISQY